MPPTRFRKAFAALALIGTASRADASTLDRATVNYMTHCGGCHGIEGRAPHTFVPDLRGHVGVFLCSSEGRAWLARVPGVSMSMIRDDQELADVLNFVIFRLDAGDVPPGTRPFTAQEVHDLRQSPVRSTDLVNARAAVLRGAQRQCPSQRG